jgi:acyl-CoA synthetase (AMP-forming)/AMP-acid ligase II
VAEGQLALEDFPRYGQLANNYGEGHDLEEVAAGPVEQVPPHCTINAIRTHKNVSPGTTTVLKVHLDCVIVVFDTHDSAALLDWYASCQLVSKTATLGADDFMVKSIPVADTVPCVIIGGGGVAEGYIHNEALTTEKFVNDPWAGPEQRTRGWTRMYRTGDRGFLDEQGCLTIEPRMQGDTEVKLRGIRMDVQDVEMAIIDTGNGAVRTAVVSMRGESDAQYLVAHLVFDDHVVPESEQKHFYTSNLVAKLPLPQYMCPAIAIPTRDLPMNSSGKLDRSAVAGIHIHPRSLDNGEAQDKIGPLSKTELELRQLWLDVLPPRRCRYVRPIRRVRLLSCGR